MVEVGRFVDGLKAAGVEFFADAPDSLLKGFYAYEAENWVVDKGTPPMGVVTLTLQ